MKFANFLNIFANLDSLKFLVKLDQTFLMHDIFFVWHYEANFFLNLRFLRRHLLDLQINSVNC
jgi:hypothetical protein